MIAGIILFSLFALVCLLGVGQDIFDKKKNAGWLTGIGCLLGFWMSLIFLVKCCQIPSDNKDKQEIPIEQTTVPVDTIPITLTIVIQNE